MSRKRKRGHEQDDRGKQLAQGHPQGVQPWGNCLASRDPQIRSTGLGDLASLSDELLLHLLGQVEAAQLACLSCVSKALYCFAQHEELWRTLVLEELEGNFSFQSSWRQTYFQGKLNLQTAATPQKGPLRVRGLFSDLLYQPWHCATVPLRQEWLSHESLPRHAGLSLQQFQTEYEASNHPVVLTDGAADWPALHKWTPKHLQQTFAGQSVLVGNYPMDFARFQQYCSRTMDEMPLYLFDKHAFEKAPQLADDFKVPAPFAEDLFSVLGPSRPDFRWLIVGAQRSGSTFHQDPNSTSAWNAVVSGSKKWVLFPPHILPPGVHASPDGVDVASPVSLIEWFLNFYEDARELRPVEGVVRAGEVLFVPKGWWHLALNLEDNTTAVTQNFVSAVNLPHVLRLLRTGSRQLVSGCAPEERADLYHRFVVALEQKHPQILKKALDSIAPKAKVPGLQSLFRSTAQAGSCQPAPGFSFKF